MFGKVENRNIIFIISTALYRVLLEVIFNHVIYPRYFQTTLVLQCNTFYYIIGWFLTIIGAYWSSQELLKKKLSSNIMVLLYFMAFLPIMMLVGIVKTDFFGELFVYFFVLIVAYYIIPDFKLIRPQKNCIYAIMNIGTIVLSLVIIYIWFKYAGHRLTLAVEDIYTARAEAYSSEMSTILRYIYTIAKSVLPMVVIFYLYTKKYLIAAWIGVLQYCIYVYDGSKTTLITFALAVGCYLIFSGVKNAEEMYPEFFASGCAIGILEYILTDKIRIIHYFIRRVLIVPSVIHYYYFDFFSTHIPDFFQGSVLRRIGFVSEYSPLGIPKTIGEIYAGTVENSMNNGLFSDAFANLGYLGILIMPILIVLVIKVFQAVSYDLPLRVSSSCFFMVVFTIISNSFWSYFITHGFIFMIILLYLWPREREMCSDLYEEVNY